MTAQRIAFCFALTLLGAAVVDVVLLLLGGTTVRAGLDSELA